MRSGKVWVVVRWLFVIALACAPAASLAAAPDVRRLTVHEWGTFTSLQDEAGRTIAGINSDDEPVPPFVHTLRWDLIVGTLSQGVPRCHPDVTMRLETPVMYFYLPPGAATPQIMDVSAEFHGGWLSQFFPYATAEAPGLGKEGVMTPGPISKRTVGSLEWNSVKVGVADAPLPPSEEHVWTSPRKVDGAASVTTLNAEGKPESEKFLFYRGVGKIDAPLVATQANGKISLATRAESVGDDEHVAIEKLWVMRIDADGKCIGAPLPAVTSPDAPVSVPMALEQQEVTLRGLPAMRGAMKQALIDAGLFENEAEAMLATWEVSYFKSPGLRVFYIVPARWLDRYLPLRMTSAADVKRVMVGRLELVTPQQRKALAQLGNAPVPTARMSNDDPLFTAYASLGRFRNALVLDELQQRPTASLREFVMINDLGGFVVPQPTAQKPRPRSPANGRWHTPTPPPPSR